MPFSPITCKPSDFDKIKKEGDISFEKFDPEFQCVIVSSGMKGKLSTLRSKEMFMKAKRKMIDKYLELYFPEMIKEVKDEDVVFLLQKLEVLKIV